MTFADAVDHKARELCRHVVRMTAEAGSGHPSSATSLAHITVVLMYHRMRYDLANPWNPHSDRLVLSEGHAVPIVYAAYADLGGVVGTDPSDARKLTLDDLMGLREIESVLDGHPNPAVGFPFFDAATGSLGQGISVAGGLGLAARLDGSDRTVYVLCGDGESREGQIWEALDFIADHCLANVRIIFNCNGMGQSDYVSPQQSPEVLARKIEAYGLHPVTIDGHDPEAISKALSLSRTWRCRPRRPTLTCALPCRRARSPRPTADPSGCRTRTSRPWRPTRRNSPTAWPRGNWPPGTPTA